jgi:predicted AlkP superfamily phosphohydrolase/phosphomutase
MLPRRLAALAVALLSLAHPTPGAAWGFTAHRLVNRRAVLTLPAPLRELFLANADYLAEHAIDPDLWRGAGREGEGPNHYLDLDAFGEWPFADLSRVEKEHLARFGREGRERGRVPWRAAEVYRELVLAFRAGDTARTLERAAVLGHYVGDAHVPLHAVLNHDGQLTGQNGFHARWESEMVDRFIRQIEPDVQPSAARGGDEPVGVVWGALVESFAEADEAFRSDRESAGSRDLAGTPADDRYDDTYYSRLFEREGPRLTARLTLAAERTGSLWLSAWEEAGRPPLDTSFRFPYVRRQSRLILASLDGSSAPVVHDAVARGVMPNLARLREDGATARGSVTSLPAKTAAGHATLFTGAWPDRHGVAGNKVVLPSASLLEPVSGYRSEPLLAEPLWVTAARQGLDATMLCATQDYPYDPYVEGKRFGGNFGHSLTFVTGYKGEMLDDAVYLAADLPLRTPSGWRGRVPAGPDARELELAVGGSTIHGLLFDDPDDSASGFDTLLLSNNKDASGGVRLKARPPDSLDGFASVAVTVSGQELPVFFRLFVLSPDGTDLLLYRARAGVLLSNRSLVATAATKATGGFVGNAAEHLYERGALGKILAEGGDGTAERRYLETVRLVERQFERLLDFGAAHTRWDLLLGYLPFPDELLHLWWGHLDPTLPGHDPALAARLRPFLDEGLGIADAYVGALARHADADTIVAVGADHGMIGVRTRVGMNVALAQAGLLVVDAGGQVDLSRTRAYFLAESGYFLINRASRPRGIVAPADEDAVRAAVARMLRGLRDPRTGATLVTEVIDPRGSDRGLGGPQGGDVYFRLAAGAFPTGGLQGPVVYEGPASGEHLLDPERPTMHASFALAGPGVTRGVDLGVIRQIDIAPTLASLLGLEPPPQATGAVLDKALARGHAVARR